MIKIMLWEVSKHHSYITPNTRASTVKRGVPRYCTRNVHASACPEVLSLTNDRKASKFKGYLLMYRFKFLWKEKSPTSNTGVWIYKTPLHVGLIASHLTNWPIDLTVCRFFVSGEKLFTKKALIVLFILVLSCLGQFLASKINNLQQ